MNYYPHHIGDYAAATAHLSWDEDMAYTRLLRRYYEQQRPIPADIDQACRLVRCQTPTQRKAVETVLREFFVLESDGWHQSRCDAEIAEFQVRADRARANGKKSHGRPSSNGVSVPRSTKPNGLITENQEQTQSVISGLAKQESQETHTLTNHNQNQIKEPASQGADAPPDPLFGFGLDFLKSKSVQEKAARSFLGLMRKNVGDQVAFELLERASRDDITDPIPWLRKAMDGRCQGNVVSLPRMSIADRSARDEEAARRVFGGLP